MSPVKNTMRDRQEVLTVPGAVHTPKFGVSETGSSPQVNISLEL